MKLLIHSQTSTTTSLTFVNGYVISPTLFDGCNNLSMLVTGAPGHERLRYWKQSTNGSLSPERMNFNYTCHEWYKIWIHTNDPQNWSDTQRLNMGAYLQVICYKLRCHPTWVPDYHKAEVHHISRHSIKNWQTDAFAYHWTLPNPEEFTDEFTLLYNNHSMFGQIGNHIMAKAGLIEQTRIYKLGSEQPETIWVLKKDYVLKWLLLSNGCVGAEGFIPDSKVHGANMGPSWGRQDPGGPHVGPTNLAIWDITGEIYH